MDTAKVDLRRVMLAGFAATSILTALMYVAPLVGFPKIDMAAAVGGFPNRPALMFSSRWWAGFVVYFAFGSLISPLLFYYAVPAFYGKPWMRGVEWGITIWGFGCVWAMFFMGIAYYEPFTSQPATTTVLTFIGHLIYGAALGLAAGRAVSRPHEAAYGWFR
jgi:hypothetical protein